MKTVLVSKAGAALTILLSFLAVYSLASALASLQTLIYAAAGLLLFALPGLILGLALFGRESHRCPEWAIFGSLLGIGLSGYTAVAVGYLIRWSPGLIVLAILILTGVCALIAAEFWSHPLLPIPRRWEYWEYVLLGAIVAALTAFVAVPLLNVGTFTAHGYAYTWLFGYDFLVRGEYVTAMTAGFPPQCMPLAGKPLNMYLVSYALPAFTYSASHKTISLHAILQLNTLAVSILFYASLLSFLRLLLTKAKVLIPTIFVCTFGYSYYWIVGLVKYVLLRPGQPEEFHKIGQQLVTYGYVSHLFTPLVLVELPALLALSLLLLLLFASELTKYEMQRYGLALCFGLILGIIFGIDGSLSMGLMLWFGIVYLVKLLMNRNHRVERFWLLFTAVLSCGGICLSFFLLGMYQWKSAHEIQFSVYSWLFKFALLYFPLEFGPLILLGVWGFILQWRRNRSTTPIALLILAAIALLQSAFIEMSVLPRIRMAVRILPFVLLVGVGYFFRYLWEYSDRRRKLCIAWGLVLLAVPTFFTDIYFASDVKNVNETHYVRIEDREACRWIHRSLPDVAVVQGEPKYLGNVDGYNGRHELFVSLIADFAERPQALGWPYIASELVPNGIDIVFHRMKDLEVMLSSTQTETILAVARKYGIQYIYVGPYEQSLHPALLSTLVAASQQFEQVYSAQGVHIFGVVEGSRPELAKLP